jgi:hypothetical protein
MERDTQRAVVRQVQQCMPAIRHPPAAVQDASMKPHCMRMRRHSSPPTHQQQRPHCIPQASTATPAGRARCAALVAHPACRSSTRYRHVLQPRHVIGDGHGCGTCLPAVTTSSAHTEAWHLNTWMPGTCWWHAGNSSCSQPCPHLSLGACMYSRCGLRST